MNNNGGKITWELDADTGAFNEKMAQADATAKATADGVDKSLSAAQQNAASQLTRLSNSFAYVGVKMTQFVTLPIVAGFAASVASASSFQNTLSQLGVISGATSNQMSVMSKTAQQLGQDTSLAGVTASDAATAMIELSKAGLSVTDTIGAARGVLELAKAGQMDFASAANIAASAIHTFNLQGKDAGMVADVLSNGANASQSSLQDLALGMEQSSSVAQLFGMSLQDNITALSLFANAGLRGSDAGTSLKQMLINLAHPSKQGAELMQQMGFSAYDANGNFVGLGEVAQRLHNSLDGMTQAQKNNALAVIFGSDSIRSASILANDAGQKWDDMSKSIDRSGTAAQVASAQYGPFRKSIEGLLNNLSQTGLEIGNILMPPLEALFGWLTKLVGAFNNSGKATQTMIIAFAVLLAVIGPLIVGVSLYLRWQALMIQLNAGVTASNGVLAASYLRLRAAILSGPWGWIILAIVAVVAVLVILQDKFHIFSKLMKDLHPVLSDIGTVFRLLFDTIRGGDPTIKKGEENFSTLARILSYVADIVRSVGAFIKTEFESIGRSLKTIFIDIRNALQPFIDQIVQFYKEHGPMINKVLQFMLVAFIALNSPILGIIAVVGAVMAGLYLLAKALDFVADHITTIVHVGKEIIDFLFAPLILILKGVAGVLTDFGVTWGSVWDGIMKIYSLAKSALKDLDLLFTNPIGTIKVAWTRLSQDAQKWPEDIWNAVKSGAEKVLKGYENVGSDIWGAIKKGFISTVKEAEQWPKEISSSIDKGISTLKTQFEQTGTSMWKEIKKGFEKSKAESIELGKSIADGIQTGITTATPKQQTQGGGIADRIFTSLGLDSLKGGIIGRLKDAAQGLLSYDISSLINWGAGIASAAEKAKQFGKGIIDGIEGSLKGASKLGGQIIDDITTGFHAAVGGLATFGSSVWSSITGGWNSAVGGIKQLGKDIITGAGGLVSGFGDGISGIVDFFTSLPGKIIGFLKGSGSQIADGVQNGTKESFTDPSKMKDLGDTILKGIGIALLAVVGGILFIAASIGIAVINGIINGIQLGLTLIGTAMDAVGSILGNAAQAAWNVITTIFSGLGTFFSNVWTAAMGVFSNVAGFFGQVFTDGWNAIMTAFSIAVGWFQGIWDGIVGVFLGAPGWFAGIFSDAWNSILNAFGSAVGWFAGVWGQIMGVFAGVGGWFGGVFSDAYNQVTSVFSGLGGWFRGIWNDIVSIFGSVGTSVGNAIGNSFRSVVNSVVSGAVGIVNGFIGSINSVVGTIDKIPGVHIGKIGTLGVPQMAEGGIVGATPGGRLINVAEAGQNEAIIPLSKLNDMINKIAITTAKATISGKSNMTDSQPTQNTYYITLPNVQNADDFAREFKLATQGRM